jgi:hypothetical protein
VKFAVDANSGRGSRFASVTFREKDGSLEHSVRVTQVAYHIGTRQEISAYRYLFTDDIYSQLRSGVTLDTINAIENLFIKRLATQLYAGNYPKEFRVQSFRSYPHPDVQRYENGTRPWNLLDNATGIIASPGDFVVFVGDIPQGQTVSLRIVDFFNTTGSPHAKNTQPLISGFNTISVHDRGLVYVMYHTDDTLPRQPVDIHFASGEVNGYFDVKKHTNADWNRLINQANPNEHFDILGNYAHIVFPVADFRRYTTNVVRLMEVYDSIVWLQLEHTGLVKYGRTKKNRNLFEVSYNPGVYMAAGNYLTNYHKQMMDFMCDWDKLRHGSVWGPAHEVGHMLQIQPFNWPGMEETTVNIGTLHVQSSFGNRSGMVSNGTYSRARRTIIEGKIAYNNADLWEKLIPLWQLELYFSKAQGHTEFYANVYEMLRVNPLQTGSTAEVPLYFVKVVSDEVQLDLSEFFTDWGFLRAVEQSPMGTVTQGMVDAIKAHLSRYPKPRHKIQDIDCENWQSFR